MHAIAVIPSRYASTRFPGKPLADIRGKTMIRRVYEGIDGIDVLDDVIVATDDERILQHVLSFGGKAVMTSAHHQSGTERCAEAVSRLRPKPDVVINVQGDEPFVAARHIHEVLSCFEQKDTQIATLIKKIEDQATLLNPAVPKVVFNRMQQAIYFSRNPIPYVRDVPTGNWLEASTYYKHLGIYAYRSNILEEIVNLPPGRLEQAERLEQLRWIENGYTIRIKETHTESMSIDHPRDIERLLKMIDS